MWVTISGQHVDITDTLREYVQRKLIRIDRHFGPVIRSNVAPHVIRNRYRTDTTVNTKGAQWHATAEDIYVVINRVVDKLDCQTIKHKQKVVNHPKEEGELENRSNT